MRRFEVTEEQISERVEQKIEQVEAFLSGSSFDLAPFLDWDGVIDKLGQVALEELKEEAAAAAVADWEERIAEKALSYY